MFILIFLLYFSLIDSGNKRLQQKSKFSFVINQNHKITLFNSIKHAKNTNKEQKNWYYIHFLINNITNITKYITIEPTDMILKNTYILFLSSTQLSIISNISLSRKIDSNDKFTDSIDKLAKSDYLLVFGPPNFALEENFNLFTIRTKINSNCYLIKTAKNSIRSKRNLIQILSSNPNVRTISIYHEPVLKNNIMSGYIQKNTRDFKRDEKSHYYFSERYLNDKRLNGEGQIVTVADTYIDFNHIMFYDPNSKFDVNVPLNHRKFVYYSFNGTVEELEQKIANHEHGTHVAGTIAGESICGTNKSYGLFDGTAPKAKLIFFKLNSYTSEKLIETMSRFGSRISSNSWDYMGFDDEGNFEYGLAAYNNPDKIFIFAAGNEYQGGNFTIDDPSGSKNTLAVGAIDDFYNDKHFMRFQSADDPSSFVDAEELKMFDPFSAGVLGNDANKSDIVFLDVDELNKDCLIFEKSKLFLVYSNSTEKVDWVKKCYIYLSRGVFFSFDYQKVKRFYEHSKSSIVSAFDITDINSSKPVQHSYYSSGGPGNKGIIKPDVMAPGTRIFSANSAKGRHGFDGCDESNISIATIKEGTSQATPNVAGAAAIIAQYFEEGRWKSNESILIDGSTMRALLINSCVHPSGSKKPDVLYGHGVIDLSTLLPLEDNQVGLQMTKMAQNSISENGHKEATLKVNSKKLKLQITLSYLDNLLAASSPILLVHDLDLVVVSPSGKVFKGDHNEEGDTQHLSTNEKVIINTDELEVGEYRIHVYTGSFIDSGINDKLQNFAVVATGSIENGYLDFKDAKNCSCNECDPKIPLHCKCDKNSVGPICQGHISIEKADNFSMTIQAHQIQRIKIESKNFFYTVNPIKSIHIESLGYSGISSVWIDKNCHLQLGEFESNLGTFQWESSLSQEIDYKSSSMCIAIFNNNYEESSFSVSVTRKNNLFIVIIASCCLVGVLVIIIVVVLIVKSRRNRQRNGFTEIKSIN